MNTEGNRREFFERLGLGSLVLAGYTATARGFAANETIGVGCIGTGGRCRALMRALKEVPGARIVAVCDIWDQHLEAGRKLADKGAFATKDHRALLAREGDIDNRKGCRHNGGGTQALDCSADHYYCSRVCRRNQHRSCQKDHRPGHE